MGTDIISERIEQGTDKHSLQVKGMYRDIHYKLQVQKMDVTSKRMLQGTDSILQDRDHTDGHYIPLFAEQLTRTFEVLVLS